MAYRLNDLVLAGELINTQRYSTRVYFKIRGHDQTLYAELTGDPSPDLRGRHIRFEVRYPQHSEGPADVEGLSWMQIGVTGTMTANHVVRTADCPATELIARIRLNEPPPIEWKRCLYLEWFGRNGRVVLEVPDPILEFVEGEDTWDPALLVEAEREAEATQEFGPNVTEVGFNEDGAPEAYEIQADMEDTQFGGYGPDEDDPISELELFDDLFEKGEGEPLSTFTDKPLSHEQLARLNDDQAEAALKGLLAELALYGVALHVCEHFTPRDAYLLLIERVLKEGRAYPELRRSQWVTHFMTSEYCPQCEAELDIETQ